MKEAWRPGALPSGVAQSRVWPQVRCGRERPGAPPLAPRPRGRPKEAARPLCFGGSKWGQTAWREKGVQGDLDAGRGFSGFPLRDCSGFLRVHLWVELTSNLATCSVQTKW